MGPTQSARRRTMWSDCRLCEAERHFQPGASGQHRAAMDLSVQWSEEQDQNSKSPPPVGKNWAMESNPAADLPRRVRVSGVWVSRWQFPVLHVGSPVPRAERPTPKAPNYRLPLQQTRATSPWNWHGESFQW